ncbi:hypothetical protein ID866_4464 [Astraeus odoratus]|nr:hypothetical protein ID866_4464 [Astraeus odoratus]
MSLFARAAYRAACSTANNHSQRTRLTTALRNYATATRGHTPRTTAKLNTKKPLVDKAPASTTATVDHSGHTEVDDVGAYEPEAVATASTPTQQSAFVGELQPGNEALSTDWSRSYYGLSTQAFPKEIADVLLAPIDGEDIEIKPDGLIYLPEIKYRRILNKAFGPGGWGLAPRTETNVGPRVVSREYALVCLGRLVGIARGEQEYFDPSGIPTATEACKSNALMRCCKDLGVASELWDPRFIRNFKDKHCVEVWGEHVTTKKKKKLWRRKDQPKLDYPYKE